MDKDKCENVHNYCREPSSAFTDEDFHGYIEISHHVLFSTF